MSDTLARKILRTWYSVLSAYPDANTPTAVRITADFANVSRSDVLRALGHSF